MSTFEVIYNYKTTNIVFERKETKEDEEKYYNNLKDVIGTEKPVVLKIGKMPKYELSPEQKLKHKKSYMHMLNKAAFDNRHISKELFDKSEIFIDRLQK